MSVVTPKGNATAPIETFMEICPDHKDNNIN